MDEVRRTRIALVTTPRATGGERDQAPPDNEGIARAFVTALERLANVLSRDGRTDDAAEAYARAAEWWAAEGQCLRAFARLFDALMLASPERRRVYYAQRASLYESIGLDVEARADRAASGLGDPQSS